jgi:AhpC/TSA family
LPALAALYEDHAEHRDRFEVIAIHDRTAASFAEIDRKLALEKIKERYWQGKDLPFPVLLDANGKTAQLYGAGDHPLGLLIAPDGKVIGGALPADLEAKLPPLPIGKLWARHRDLQKNIHWSHEPQTSLKEFINFLKHPIVTWPGCVVELDAAAVKASGLTPDGPLPGAVFGEPITLRSIVELLLAPHGLGVAPSPDGKKLLITKPPAAAEAESYFQKFRARELSDRLDPGSAAGPQAEGKILEIKDQALLDAVKRVSEEFDLPVALDAKAMGAGALDVTARVSGRIAAGDLRKSLAKMLQPLGLTVEVRAEVVFVTKIADGR